MATRRDILRSGLAGTLALGTMAPAVSRGASSDYKALVCIMLHGGLDAHDCVVPTSAGGYADWAGHRRNILPDDGTRERAAFEAQALTGHSQSFGFAPELSRFKELYDADKLAVVANVGPLQEPTNRQRIRDGLARLPFKLGSHNDQSSMWMTNQAEGAPTGWGGRMLDELSQGSDLAGISFDNNAPMVAGSTSPGVTIGVNGVRTPMGMRHAAYKGSDRLRQLVEEHYRTAGQGHSNRFVQEVSRAQRRAIDATVALEEALDGQNAGDGAKIGGNHLSEQLATVTDLIASRSVLGLNRQVFFVTTGGFDTHFRQFNSLPSLQRNLAEAIHRFQTNLDALGLGDMVTTFTSSEFGRTLVTNASGTDHGWGSHHYVVGGAVTGGRVIGEFPEYTTGHEQDWQRGAMIPTVSIEQFGGDLGAWFGLSASQIRNVFPNYGRFNALPDSVFL